MEATPEVETPTPVLLWTNSMSAEHAPSDNTDGHDESIDYEPADGPSEETYRKHALDGAERTLYEELDFIKEELGDIQNRLRDGENPTPEDLMAVQTALGHSTESIVGSLEELVVGEEPEIVATMRELALQSNLQMLHAARHIRDGQKLYPGPYKFGTVDVAWAFAVMELLEEHGAVAESGEAPAEIEDIAALSSIIDEVEAADRVELVREGGGDEDE